MLYEYGGHIKEEILKASRELIRQQGWSAVSIRSVAAACGASLLLAGVRFGYHFGEAASAASESI